MADILVIDDDEQMNALLTQMLRHAGYEVASASDGRQAVELLGRHADVKVIVTDILMPDMDGMELILKLRFQKGAPAIVAVSGGGKFHAAGECLAWAKDLGIRHTFEKPIRRAAFLKKIKQLMNARQ